MQSFIQGHQDQIKGVLSCLDRTSTLTSQARPAYVHSVRLRPGMREQHTRHLGKSSLELGHLWHFGKKSRPATRAKSP
jgi:hypothetical protein